MGQNTPNQYQKAGEKIFLKTCIIFEKISTLQNSKFLKNLFFDFHKIQNLGAQRPKLLGPQSSASSLDLFGQGEQFSQNVCIFVMKEGLNQKITLCKLVLEFNFMANRTLKK